MAASLKLVEWRFYLTCCYEKALLSHKAQLSLRTTRAPPRLPLRVLAVLPNQSQRRAPTQWRWCLFMLPAVSHPTTLARAQGLAHLLKYRASRLLRHLSVLLREVLDALLEHRQIRPHVLRVQTRCPLPLSTTRALPLRGRPSCGLIAFGAAWATVPPLSLPEQCIIKLSTYYVRQSRFAFALALRGGTAVEASGNEGGGGGSGWGGQELWPPGQTSPCGGRCGHRRPMQPDAART